MGAITRDIVPAGGREFLASGFSYDDPLDEDGPGDPVFPATRRRLTRLALVAAETAARFQREAVGHDPVAWMLAPRRIFGGSAALDACLEREHCLRAVLLHGLSLGLDAAPATVDALLADGVPDGDAGWAGDEPERGAGRTPGSRRLRLYSAVIVVARGGELLHAFHASVAPSAAVVRERIRARLGTAAAQQAEIRLGFDPDCPGVAGMIPPAIEATLTAAGRRSRWAALDAIDVTVEQRIPS